MSAGDYGSRGVMAGMVSQAGGRPPGNGGNANRANGLNIPGVVVATYVQLAEDAPAFDDKIANRIVGVYCDVLTYGTRPNALGSIIPKALVVQNAGMHNGHVWHPRAATIDAVKRILDIQTADPRNLDGDHVLIQFLEDNLQKPIITGRLPHPMMGLGNEDDDSVGHRMLFRTVDGDPSFWKQNGSYFGVDRDGTFRVDTTRAHSGNYAEDGAEVPDPAEGGGQEYTFKNGQTFKVIGRSSDGADVTVLITLQDGSLSFRLDDSNVEALLEDSQFTISIAGVSLTLTGSAGSAVLTVGSGTDNAVSWAALNTWWTTIKTTIDAEFDTLRSTFNSHQHNFALPGGLFTGTDSSGSPTAQPTTGTITLPVSQPAPHVDALSTSVKSTKLKMPPG